MKEIMFGFKPSEIDGSEKIFNGSEKIELPKEYTYRPYLPKVFEFGLISTATSYILPLEHLTNFA